MKHFLTLSASALILLTAQTLYAQTTRTVKIWDKTQEKISALYTYDESNNLVDLSAHLMVLNSEYQHITDYVTLYHGQPEAFYAFLTEVENFAMVNEPDVETKIQDIDVSLHAFGKTVEIIIFVDEGYHAFRVKDITKMREKFEAWANDNGISLQASR